MGVDVIVGYDRKPRCAWVDASDKASARYHDEVWGTRTYEVNRKRAPGSAAELPRFTAQAETFAKQLKSQGYRFVGPTSVYAFMQNVGVVNDHVHGCFRATDY